MQVIKQITCKDGTRKNAKTQECEPIKENKTRKKKLKLKLKTSPDISDNQTKKQTIMPTIKTKKIGRAHV